ncbi:NAD(P)H-quinone oxidoreductase subunit 5 [Herbaspirillum sp. Sphag1AN]|uniref:NADH-quinone oxidoreductase subunit L n=1 Tax=unclassified Herbaspirillum TaxID=2624150 RepID=UPI001819B225|nr:MULTISPECIES: NADH-quinone oxidoreductase subunit L [unclassified Herbaspirillum]MBB3212568.1 NAD(P)H-quinone oxidoreductase subunit 5 [Herbaspirillum sp. Sphag1AN]MBB3245765.1 NAD(P)H-quinone oxidoreductase subunit 5 [Herbaspirillum sp. Sphag64]
MLTDHWFIPLMLTLALLPAALMLLCAALAWRLGNRMPAGWPLLKGISLVATVVAALSLLLQWWSGSAETSASSQPLLPGLCISLSAAWVGLLVQALGTVIISFSARYLQGESRQARYAAALCGVLTAVHLLLLADHWALLIAAWAGVGLALHPLLCCYEDRPFAALAAHKKFLADRLADLLLIAAAVLAVQSTGSGTISTLLAQVQTHGADVKLQWCAVLLALAVAIRTALLPLHGWLIQVMEAPTPVSALLHAGVVNLGGMVLIHFAPLLAQVPVARYLLLVLGLLSTALAGFVMLTRISIKVRLAWSTLAQMGFMLLECAVGLHQLALLHLLGHSLYKAHTFLSAGNAVEQAGLRDLQGTSVPRVWSLLLAPLLCGAVLSAVNWSPSLMAGFVTNMHGTESVWPWWWTVVLALAWAPMLWLRNTQNSQLGGQQLFHLLTGLLLATLLSLLALLAHALPLGVVSTPHEPDGMIVIVIMSLIYLGTALLQLPAWRARLEPLRRQSYAGFYLDEAITRLTLWLWPVRLPPASRRDGSHVSPQAMAQPLAAQPTLIRN